MVRRSPTVRRRLWIPRCIAHTTRTKRYIAARRGEKDGTSGRGSNKDGAGGCRIQHDIAILHASLCRFSKCEQMTSTADILTLREIRRVFWRSVMRDYLGWNYWRCLLAFSYICTRQPSYSYVPCRAWCMFAKICDMSPRKAGPHMECHIQFFSGSLRSSTRW